MTYIFDRGAFVEADFAEGVHLHSREHSCAKSATIFREGDEEGGLMQIVEGVAEVQMPTAEGEVILTHLLWPGDWIGEGLLLTNAPRSRYLIARTDLVYRRIPHLDLLRMLERDPQGWRAIGRIALYHQRVAMRAYLDASIRYPVGRCLATLLRLAGLALARPAIDFSRNVPISQEELGRMTNLCRNSTGKALHCLAQDNVVRAGYRKLEIPSVDRAFDYMAALSN